MGHAVRPYRDGASRVRTQAAAVAIALAGCVALLLPATPAAAAEPEAGPDSSVSIAAEPLLGGTFRPGAWAAVRVRLENGGPALDGELRISSAGQRASTFGIAVHLAPGARQEHILYGQTAPFGRGFTITLVSGGAVHATVPVPVAVNAARSAGIYVVAERPEALAGPIHRAAFSGQRVAPQVVTIGPEDLPPRAEAWSSVDLLVWQDVDSSRLTGDQVEALETWLTLGGQLMILGGSTGTTTLGAFPPALLPYRPVSAVEVSAADLAALLGSVPDAAAPIPAVGGPLEQGVALARAGEYVVAARRSYGQGSVALIGIDPSARWLAGSRAADSFWARTLPSTSAAPDPRSATGDDFIVYALGTLPAVQVPRIHHLALLMIAYVLAIGPINYLLLRRRDRREWAWLTMPATIALFAVAAYGFGALLKGANVVVNELAVVRGSVGADHGLADIHVGLYSPSRSSFDVEVGPKALVSAPATDSADRPGERPLDVLLGDPATLRGYAVGFGAQRAFRAQTSVSTPRVEAELRLVGDLLEGTVTNAADVSLEDVSLVFGEAAYVLGELEPGESRSIELSTVQRGGLEGRPFSWRLVAPAGTNDAARVRTVAARRALLQHVAGGWNEGVGRSPGLLAGGPLILAWRPGGILQIDAGVPAEHVGETLYILPARATVLGEVVFEGAAVRYSTLVVDALEAFDEGGLFYLGRGTMTVEYRPVGFDGSFAVSGLSVRLGLGRSAPSGAGGEELPPLPAAEQPDPDAPLASDPRLGDGLSDLPRLQLFDRASGTWVEFEPARASRTYRIADPSRYVDEAGAVRVRFVRRSNDFTEFGFVVRLEGTVE